MSCAALALMLVLLAACGRIELYHNLSEEEANEIMVLLSENSIKANKKKVTVQNEVTFAIEVPEVDMSKARSLLVQNNLPRKKSPGLAETYKEKGLIPTPDEQKARYLMALKGEIINSLERIPQIIDADVVLNIPTKSEFASAEEQKLQRPTASVIIRVKPDPRELESVTEPKIQQFVANAIEGLNPRDVTVIISYVAGEDRPRPGEVKTLPTQAPGLPLALGQGQGQAQTTPVAAAETNQELMGLNLDAESKGRLRVYLLAFFVLLAVLASALIIVIMQASRMRRTISALQGPAGQHPAIEGQIMDEGPPRIGGGG